MRLGEICRITWDDLNGDVQMIRDRKHPTDKVGNDPRVPLLGRCPEILAGLERKSDRVWPYPEDTVGTAWRRARDAAGVIDLQFHDLRHTGITRLFQLGFDDTDDTVVSTTDEEEEDDGLKPLSDRLVMELTAHRHPGIAQCAGPGPAGRLPRGPARDGPAALLPLRRRQLRRDRTAQRRLRIAGAGPRRHGLCAGHRPAPRDLGAEPAEGPEDLWEALTEFDSCSREALFAHCVAMSVNAVHDPYQRRPRAIAHADVLAGTVGLDMAKAGWTATGDSYLGRVTKARILEAVREAKGEDAADRIAGLKKAEMVTAAEDLLVGTGWLPDPLRTPSLPEEDAPEIELVDEADGADGRPSDDDPDSGEAQSAEDGGAPAIGELRAFGRR